MIYSDDQGFVRIVDYDKGSYVGLEIRYHYNFVNVSRYYSKRAVILPGWWIAAI